MEKLNEELQQSKKKIEGLESVTSILKVGSVMIFKSICSAEIEGYFIRHILHLICKVEYHYLCYIDETVFILNKHFLPFITKTVISNFFK